MQQQEAGTTRPLTTLPMDMEISTPGGEQLQEGVQLEEWCPVEGKRCALVQVPMIIFEVCKEG